MESSESDETLLEAWRRGDLAAADVLLHRHVPSVSRFLCRRVSEADAEEILQRTFLACVEALDRQIQNFRTYVFGIARKQMLMHLRRNRQGPSVEALEAEAIARTTFGPASLVARREEHRLLLRALGALPTDLQIVVELFYWEGLTHVEIAEVVEIPEGTVKTRLWRARSQIEARLIEYGASPDLSQTTLRELGRWAAEVARQARDSPK